MVRKVYVERVPTSRQHKPLQLAISGGDFQGNLAHGSGGAFYINGGVAFQITGGKFLGNSARYGGGVGRSMIYQGMSGEGRVP